MNDQSLRIALTMGDPAGVGPEILLRYFSECPRPDGAAPFVVGEARHLEQAAGLPSAFPAQANLEIVPCDEPPDAALPEGTIPVVAPPDFRYSGAVDIGRVSPECGRAAWAYIRHAVNLVLSGRADAVVTAPIHKEALRGAGCPHPGHTEMLAELAGGARVAMLLVGGGLRVALATIHEPFTRVRELLTIDGIAEHLRLLDRFIPWFGIDGRPRLGVTGLNPHAGEGGLFGTEEAEIIAPAIERARSEGINAVGPLPGDTAFFFQREGAYDAMLAMYHDQGLIPVKTLDFHGGVNVTMGLPFIRTSVDHGTAFDIAGRGLARADSLRAAVDCAILLARNRRQAESMENA